MHEGVMPSGVGGDRNSGEAAARMPRNGGTVVIADGNVETREEISRALDRAGYRTRGVGTAGEAREAARDDDVKLVLLEVELPDLTGYEACRELRDEHGDSVAIFFVAGPGPEASHRV